MKSSSGLVAALVRALTIYRAAAVCGLVAPIIVFAQVPLAVLTEADSGAAGRLSLKLKEAAVASPLFKPAPDGKAAKMTISLIAMAPANDEAHVWTIYSAAFTWENTNSAAPFFLSHVVGRCGSDRVQSCAESILARAHELYERRVK